MSTTQRQVKQAIYRGTPLDLYVSTDAKVYDMNMNEKSYHNTNNRGPGTGYVAVYHCGTSYMVHRMVAETFIPNPDNLPTVNHKLGDKSKNTVDDLEWMSYSDNNKHALEFGLRKPLSCDKHQNATFTNEQVHEICKLLQDGVLYDDIIEIMQLQGTNFELRRRLIMIKNGYAWKEISSQYEISEKRNSATDKYSEEQIRAICELMQAGEKDWRKIVEAVGLEPSGATRKLVSTIRCGGKHAMAHIIAEYNIPEYGKQKYTEDQIRYICYLIQRDPTCSAPNILKLADIPVTEASKNTVYSIRSRKSYIDISKDYKW